MIVLGLDPSLTAYGWAIVDRSRDVVLSAGCIRTEKDARKSHMYAADQDALRVIMLAEGLEEAVLKARSFAGSIDQSPRIVCEAPAGAQHAASAKALGQSFGVTLGILVAAGLYPRLVQAHEVKLRLGGSRDASKAAVADGVQAMTSWRSEARTKPSREAEYDAAAVALMMTLEELRA